MTWSVNQDTIEVVFGDNIYSNEDQIWNRIDIETY